MKCEICGKEILRDSQCINYKYYHNGCIENLQEENKQLKEKYKIVLDKYINIKNKHSKQVNNWNKLKEYLESYKKIINDNPSIIKQEQLDVLCLIEEIIQELEGSDNNVND